MTGAEIQAAIRMYVKVSISNDDMVLLINEALDEIADKGFIFGEVEVEAAANTWYEMPEECVAVIDVRDSDDEIYNGWRQQGTLKIRFADAGTYNVTARRLADHIAAISDNIPVHQAFHRAIVTYGRAFKKLQVNDESSDGNSLKQQFYAQIEAAYRSISRRKPTQWKVIRHA
jgi:hypothetical protein